ncbi:MAG: PP2C family protein-serine/threonine phosphatase, partial [Candidatus Woesearchaeota archaeon]
MSSKGFALISSKELKIKEVLYNSEEFSFLEEGRLLPSFVDSDSRRKLLNFSKILEEKGAEFAYEIYVKVSEKVQAVFLSGTIINDNELLLIAPFEKEGIIDQYDYFMQVNNKYINQLRTLLKRQFKNINLSQENNFLKNRRDYNYIEFSKINNEAVTNQRQLVKTNNKLESKKDQISKLYTKLDNEINKAWKIHKRSFPNIIPDLNNIYIKAQYLPSERLGGDIYDIIKVENKLVFYLADVTGHGLDAAMMSSFIHHNIRDFLSLSQIDEIDTKSIIAFLMKRFAEEKFPQDYFICIFINILDLETMNL